MSPTEVGELVFGAVLILMALGVVVIGLGIVSNQPRLFSVGMIILLAPLIVAMLGIGSVMLASAFL